MVEQAIAISRQHEMIVAPGTPAIARAVPHAVEVNGHLALPHKFEETKLLRNMGYEVPAPIMYQYDWANDTPFTAQKITASMLSMNKRAFCLNDMGTGKTRSVLYAFDHLRKQGLAKRMLVVAPLSTLNPTWFNEVFRVFPHLECMTLHGTKAQRLKKLEYEADVYVINHHGVDVVLTDLIDRHDIDVIVIDELAVFRNQRANMYRAMKKLIAKKEWVWGLTGSPTPNAPTDAWAQTKLLRPGNVPVYFKQFQAMTMTQVSQFRYVNRAEANEVVHNVMQPSVRFTREQCLDLPALLPPIDQKVNMHAKQKMIYDKLYNHLRISFQAGSDVVAVNEGVLMNKLLQVSLGHVYDQNHKPVHFPNKDRLDAIREVIEANSRKTIVFVPFVHAVEATAEFLRKTMEVDVIYGATPKRERDDIFARFQNSAKPKVIVAHPKTMSHGLTLTAANTIIWHGPPQSLETYEQANARISRPSQTAKQLIIHLYSTPVEKKVFKRLKKKQKMQGALLQLFEEST